MAGHSFDRASEGYVNLLAANMKSTGLPGDTAGAVQARNRLLQGGWFAPAVQKIAEVIGASDLGDAWIGDPGCGTGYFLNQLREKNGGISIVGFDISKAAIKVAAKNYPLGNWFVANARKLPLGPGCLDALLLTFSPAFSDLGQHVKPGGRIIVVNGGNDHLAEVRTALYQQERNRTFEPPEFAVGIEQTDEQVLTYEIRIEDSETLADLIDMTPFRHTSSRNRQEAFISQGKATITIDLVLHVYRVEGG